jgi:hypothetical protein
MFKNTTTECLVATTLRQRILDTKKKYELSVQIATGEIVWAPVPGPDADGDVLKFHGLQEIMLKGEYF